MRVRLSLLVFLGLSALSAVMAAEIPCVDWLRDFSIKELKTIRFKAVDDSVLNHKQEKRGFIEVPLDYSRKSSPKIKVFYRMIPASGSDADDKAKPIIVYFNGGPGLPSWGVHGLDFDYENPKAKQNQDSRFQFLPKSFRMLMIDQRGTAGYSAPLDFSKPYIDPVLVHQFFGPKSQAEDMARVIDAVVPKNEKFFINGQSYGGHLALYYMMLKKKRMPDGLILSSAGLPHADPFEEHLERRRSQIDLNYQLLSAVPDIKNRLQRLNDRLTEFEIEPHSVHYLWSWLGKGADGVWQKKLAEKIDELALASRSDIEAFVREESDGVSLLNYILSATVNTPGYTDRSLSLKIGERLPMESWMIDENNALAQLAKNDRELDRVIRAIDQNVPPVPYLGSNADIRKSLSKTEVLFTFGEGDAYLPKKSSMPLARKMAPKNATFKVLPGGHAALYLETGHTALLKWMRQIKLK